MEFLTVIFWAILALVVSYSNAFDNEVKFENNFAYGYHTRYGQPLAAKIRKVERESSNVNTAIVPGDRIVKGVLARTGDFPYQAGILIEVGLGDSVCGGALLNAKRVLTAAHCWWDGKNQAIMFTVILGSVKLYSGGTRLDTTDVIIHNKWDPKLKRNDIAMVNLPRAVKFSKNINPIALPSGWDLGENFVGHPVIVAGFGYVKDDDAITLGTCMSFTKMQVISNQKCHTVFRVIQPSHICAQGPYRENICGGDSGSPLAIIQNHKRVLIGVTAFGNNDTCQDGLPSAFTRVTAFMDWIKMHLYC